MSELIRAEHLSKVYTEDKRRPVRAVNDVSFSVKQGEVFGLVGESGCGKSTLGQIMTCLTPASDGSLFFHEKNVFSLNKKDLKELRRKIQIIFQDPYSSINPKKTIGWLVEEPLIIHGFSDEERRKEKVTEILRLVGLDAGYINRYPSELSGGQRLRVAIAIALILEPEFVVCDEAVSALDVSVQAQVLNLLMELREKIHLTYLFISHNLNVVSYVSDRIAVMYLGNIVELAKAEEISAHALHPYTLALFSASNDLSDEKKERIVLKGDLPSPANPPGGCPFHTRCPYAKEKCAKEKPELKEQSDGHLCACHFPLRGDRER